MDIDGLGPTWPLADIELHAGSFPQISKAGGLKDGMVDKDLRAAFIRCDETKTLLSVEPMHNA